MQTRGLDVSGEKGPSSMPARQLLAALKNCRAMTVHQPL